MKYNKISIVMHTFMDKWNVKTCLCYIEREWRRQDPVMSVRSTETKLILFKKKKKKISSFFLIPLLKLLEKDFIKMSG